MHPEHRFGRNILNHAYLTILFPLLPTTQQAMHAHPSSHDVKNTRMRSTGRAQKQQYSAARTYQTLLFLLICGFYVVFLHRMLSTLELPSRLRHVAFPRDQFLLNNQGTIPLPPSKRNKASSTMLDMADMAYAGQDYQKAVLLYHEVHKEAININHSEDLYHSLYGLSQCHGALYNTKAAIHYAQKAFEVSPRAEPMLYMAQIIEEQDEESPSSDNYYYDACQAAMGPGLASSIFERDLFDKLQAVEQSILWPRRFSRDYLAKLASFQAIMDDEDASIETHEQVHWEMIANTRAILGCAQELFRREGTFHKEGDFYYATPSLIRRRQENGGTTTSTGNSRCDVMTSTLQAEDQSDSEFLILVRLLNYRIDHEGRWYKDFLPSGQDSNILRSAAALFVNTTDRGSILRVLDDPYEKSSTRFLGTEDPKLLAMNDGTIRIVWTSWEYAKDGGEGSRLVMGILDTKSLTIQLDHVFPSPFDHFYEKNWVAFQRPACDALYFIYQWYPLRIGMLDTDRKAIQFNMTRSTPRSFHHLRGSSNGVIYQNDVWLIVHGTTWHKGPGPSYYHRMVVLDSVTFEVKRFTFPFKLESTEAPVEFSLGLDIDCYGNVTIAYSVFDGSAVLRRIPIWKLEALMVKTSPGNN